MTRLDPYKDFRFLLEIDGIHHAGFNKVSGLEEEAVRKLTGLRKYGNITLKLGYTKDLALWDWHQAGAAGKTERKNGSNHPHGRGGKRQSPWNFIHGWPGKWQGPSLSADVKEVAIEMLEIEHEGLEKG